METRPPLPPFTQHTAVQKVRLAEDGWNSRDPARVALAYTEDTRWRNRAEFPVGRDAARQLLEPSGHANWTTASSRSCGRSAATASPCVLPTNGMTMQASGTAATATRTGSSTTMA